MLLAKPPNFTFDRMPYAGLIPNAAAKNDTTAATFHWSALHERRRVASKGRRELRVALDLPERGTRLFRHMISGFESQPSVSGRHFALRFRLLHFISFQSLWKRASHDGNGQGRDFTV